MDGRWKPIISVLDAVECMVPTLGPPGPPILLMSTVRDDFVGPGDSFVLSEENLPMVSAEVLFNLPLSLGVRQVLFGSRSSGPIETLNDRDMALTNWLLREASRQGLSVVEHIVVRHDAFRLMGASLADLN